MTLNHAKNARFIFAGLTLALMSACANVANIPPGTPIAQVESSLGRPDYTCPEPNGGQRLIWTGQPFGQYAWGTRTDSSGRIDGIVPLLTDKHFKVLSEGTWTPEQVLCEFGPPAEKGGVGLPSSLQIVWSYRYLQDRVWNSMMHVYFGQDGARVTRVHPGPDPMYDRDHFFF